MGKTTRYTLTTVDESADALVKSFIDPETGETTLTKASAIPRLIREINKYGLTGHSKKMIVLKAIDLLKDLVPEEMHLNADLLIDEMVTLAKSPEFRNVSRQCMRFC